MGRFLGWLVGAGLQFCLLVCGCVFVFVGLEFFVTGEFW